MNKFRLDEHQRIERYILCKMDDDEASEFEAGYLSDQECLEQLEIAKKLHQGLEVMAKSSLPESSIAANVKVDAPQIASNDSSWWKAKVPAWSLAAMLLVALTPSFPMFKNADSGALPEGGLSVVSVALSGMRSKQQPKLVLQESAARTILSFYVDTEIESVLYSQYAFQIKSLSGNSKRVGIKHLKLDANDMLYVDLGTSYLKKGEYEYSIAGVENNSPSKSLYSGTLNVE